jgi:hypothetical protein
LLISEIETTGQAVGTVGLVTTGVDGVGAGSVFLHEK